MIYFNKHPAGRVSNVGFGLVCLLDGLVRVLSLGFFNSTFALDYARWQAKHLLDKKVRQAAQPVTSVNRLGD
jgi:hypothetical protein